jgi:hypothetical protein
MECWNNGILENQNKILYGKYYLLTQSSIIPLFQKGENRNR